MKPKILFLLLSIFSICNISFSQQFYKIPYIYIKDIRIEKALTDYIFKEQLTDVEGAIILQFDKENPDRFYIGYIVYKIGVTNNPPSYYTKIKGKPVLVYTGFEQYLSYTDESFKDLLKDVEGMFPPEGGVIVEPTYWQFNLIKDGYKKYVVQQLPY